jgi:hypothetical protein
LRLPARLRLARIKLTCSPAGKLAKAAHQRVSHCSRVVAANLSVITDRLEHALPSRLAGPAHHLRNFSPLSLGSYALYKFKQDPTFLAGYGVFSWGFTNLQTPLLMGLGFGPVAAVALRIATGIPMDLGVVALREHQRREDRSRSFLGTLSAMGREYNQHVNNRREEHRRFIRQRASEKHPSQLRLLERSLTGAGQ